MIITIILKIITTTTTTVLLLLLAAAAAAAAVVVVIVVNSNGQLYIEVLPFITAIYIRTKKKSLLYKDKEKKPDPTAVLFPGSKQYLATTQWVQ